MTRDAGTQSTPYLSSTNLSTHITPTIIKRPIKFSQNSPNSNTKTVTEDQVEEKKEKEERVREVNENVKKDEEDKVWQQSGGCFSWSRKKTQREKERQRKDNMFFTHFKLC